MAVTGEQIFTAAMALMDEIVEDGSVGTQAQKSYKPKTAQILTTLQSELLPSTTTPVVITDLTQPLLLSDHVCLVVLPYGLAAHLMITEDLNLASFFNQRYEELKTKNFATITPIIDNYDVLSGMQ